MITDEIFLTAEWRNLAMLNYEVDAGLLLPFVPAGTEIDRWNGKVFISLVGFRFLKTRIFGVPVPFHVNFDEVNLRFYVRRHERDEIRRGVVFIKEIVPRRAIAWIARALYNENYVALPMAHEIGADGESGLTVAYRWRTANGWNAIQLKSQGTAELANEGSHEQFITEQYWGYAAQPDGGSMEYRVTHPAWKVWSARSADFEGDVDALYGREFAAVLCGRSSSAFLAEGSAVTVMRGRKVRPLGLKP